MKGSQNRAILTSNRVHPCQSKKKTGSPSREISLLLRSSSPPLLFLIFSFFCQLPPFFPFPHSASPCPIWPPPQLNSWGGQKSKYIYKKKETLYEGSTVVHINEISNLINTVNFLNFCYSIITFFKYSLV